MLQVFVTSDAFQFILDYLFDVLLYLIVVVLNSLLHAVVAIGILEVVDDGDRLIMAFLSLSTENVQCLEDMEELKHLRNDVGSQLASMECVPRHNTVDCPTLFWAAIPGNEGDFPSEESFHTFIEQSVCLFTEETNYMDSPSPFGIKMADRISGKPLDKKETNSVF